MILFSLATVVASEDMSCDNSTLENGLDVGLASQDSGCKELQMGENQKVPAGAQSSSGNVDLSVKIDVEPSCVDGKYNPVGSEVPWTITVTAKGGTAHNTKVREVLSANMGYVAHNLTVGSYDSSTGIWDIGDLTSSSKASLTILTKLNREGTYMTKAYATTDSNDNNQLNNFAFLSIKTGSSKSTSNITETSDDREEPTHNSHYASMMKNRLKKGKTPSNNPGGGHKNGSQSNSSSVSKNIFGMNSLTVGQSVVESIFDTDNSSSNSSNIHSDAKPPYQYMQIPILVFALFFILLFAIMAYNRKNR